MTAWLIAALLAAGFAGGVSAQPAASKDAAITAGVQTAIRNDASLGKMDISVQTRDGVVRLSGFVNSTDDIARAAALARAVAGVSTVKNELRVADRPSRG